MADELDSTNESVNTAVHGLKNELTRLHQLHQNLLIGLVDTNPTSGGPEADEVWTRIIVIQEELLNLTGAYSAKIKKETENETSTVGRGKRLQGSMHSRSRRMR